MRKKRPTLYSKAIKLHLSSRGYLGQLRGEPQDRWLWHELARHLPLSDWRRCRERHWRNKLLRQSIYPMPSKEGMSLVARLWMRSRADLMPTPPHIRAIEEELGMPPIGASREELHEAARRYRARQARPEGPGNAQPSGNSDAS
jgi:hypothetical protein